MKTANSTKTSAKVKTVTKASAKGTVHGKPKSDYNEHKQVRKGINEFKGSFRSVLRVILDAKTIGGVKVTTKDVKTAKAILADKKGEYKKAVHLTKTVKIKGGTTERPVFRRSGKGYNTSWTLDGLRYIRLNNVSL